MPRGSTAIAVKERLQIDNFRDATHHLVKLYGDLPAAEFRPKKFKAVRQAMVDDKQARRTINSRCRRIKQVMAWAGEEELVPGSVQHARRHQAAFVSVGSIQRYHVITPSGGSSFERNAFPSSGFEAFLRHLADVRQARYRHTAYLIQRHPFTDLLWALQIFTSQAPQVIWNDAIGLGAS